MEEAARSAGSEPDEPERIPCEEMAEALRSLTGEQMRRVERYARNLCLGGGRDPDELIGEAFCAIMLGDRTCRRGVDPVAFLAGSMRSILWNEVRKDRRNVPLPEENGEVLVPKEVMTDPRDESELVDAARRERLFEMKDALETALLEAEDEECLRLYQAKEKGLRGAALAEELQVDQTRLPTILTRLRRAVRRVTDALPHQID